MKKPKSIHFVGIKGVGMAPLALVAKQAGIKVTGCDLAEEFITDKALQKGNIEVFSGFSPSHTEGIDLVVTTGAHGGLRNPEVIFAKEKNISVLTQGEAVGKFMTGAIIGKNGLVGISVAGSHGKTTTVAMIATLLKSVGMDPSYVVGTSDIASLGSPGHFGKGNYFIAEADEYATEPSLDKTPKFLWQHPKILVVTNIEYDHPDIYSSVEDVAQAFYKMINSLPKDAVVVACGDDITILKLKGKSSMQFVTYGFNEGNDVVIRHVRCEEGQTFFWLEYKGANIGEFCTSVIGEHNAKNATATLVVATELGITFDKIRKGLISYMGSKRRSEFVGKTESGMRIFDDYAHHPTEIKKTLSSFKKVYPKFRIVCVFQPHTYSRTKKLLEDFSRSFNDASEVIVMEIYPSLREEVDSKFSAARMVELMSKYGTQSVFLPSKTDVLEYIKRKQYGKDSILLTFGAGNVYKIGHELTVKK